MASIVHQLQPRASLEGESREENTRRPAGNSERSSKIENENKASARLGNKRIELPVEESPFDQSGYGRGSVIRVVMERQVLGRPSADSPINKHPYKHLY